MMKSKMIFGVLALAVALTTISLVATAGTTGNGAPSGFHETINIVGVNGEKNENYTGGNGSTIFVLRTGSTQFYVQGGTSFQIVDHDGTDGKVGSGGKPTDTGYVPGLIFPYDATETPTWRVQIWVRLQGPVDSSCHWYVEKFDGTDWVFYDQFSLSKGTPSKFTEHTSDLLADGFKDMLWTLDQKTNFRLCQMRVYLQPSTQY